MFSDHYLRLGNAQKIGTASQTIRFAPEAIKQLKDLLQKL